MNELLSAIDAGPAALLALAGTVLYRLLLRGDRVMEGAMTSIRAQRDAFQRRAEIAEAKLRVYERRHGPLNPKDVIAELEATVAWDRAWRDHEWQDGLRSVLPHRRRRRGEPERPTDDLPDEGL